MLMRRRGRLGGSGNTIYKASGVLFSARFTQSGMRNADGDPPATNEPVKTILDLSGNDDHAVQNTEAKQGIFRGNTLGLQMDGSDDGYSLPIASSTGSYTVIVRVAPTTVASARYIIDAQIGRLIFTMTDAAGQYSYYDGVFRQFGAASTGEQVLTFLLNGTGQGSIRKNGTALNTLTYASKNIGGSVALGMHNSGTGAHLNGYFRGGIIIAERIFTVDEIALGEAWV